MKRAGDVIEGRRIIAVDERQSVLDAVRAMVAGDVGAVAVLDAEQLVGMFTERDVMARVVARGLGPESTPVGAVMSTALVTADVSESYEACLARMQQARVRHLLVLERGRLRGVLSMRDLVAVDLDEKDEAITMLNAYMHDRPAGSRPTPQRS
jgi:CBS domain-containing protein